MVGISDKALKSQYAVNKYRYNGKELQNQEFSDGSGLEEYDYGARKQDPQIGRWLVIDPMASKFKGLSPYAYTANNPVLLYDLNGKDWTISRQEDKNGNITYNITFKGQVYNNSKQKIDTKAMAKSISRQMNEYYNVNYQKGEDGAAVKVNFSSDITSISDKKDLASDATLLEIDDGSDENFKSNVPGEVYAGIAITGKKLMINADYADQIINDPDDEIVSHEAGHTAGLPHPADDKQKGFFFWSTIPGPTANSPGTNFMHHNLPSPVTATGVTRSQIYRMYMLYSQGKLNTNDDAANTIFESIEKPFPAR